jgi:hypothetical protein
LQIIGRTHHMLVSCWGKRWNEVWLAMCHFTAYIDDSGTAPSNQVAIATALLIPADRIVALEREWDRLKKKEGFSCFRMTVFADSVNWKEENHARLYRRVREIIKKYGVRTVSFAVFKKDYDEAVPADLRQHSGTYHYSWAVRNLIDELSRWRRSHVKHPLEYVFQWMGKRDPSRKEIETVMDQHEEVAIARGDGGEYANYTFRHSKELPGLQCVDVLAWVSYQTALLAFCNTPLHPEAEIGWKDFDEHLGGTWRDAYTVSRSALEKWVNNPAAVEHTKRWFAAYKRKRAGKVNEKKKRSRKV